VSDTYIPGTCNLGKAEVRSRQIVALVGLVATLILATGLTASSAPQASGLTLFAPLMVFAVGFIQSRRKFCLAYGLAGNPEENSVLPMGLPELSTWENLARFQRSQIQKIKLLIAKPLFQSLLKQQR